MKRLLLLLVLVAGAHAAPDPAAVFREAGAAYARGDFHSAVGLYERLLKESAPSAALYTNLGNAYFKSGSLARAVLAYERAHRIDPSNAVIVENLAIANARLRDQVEPMPLLFVVQWWNTVKDENTPASLLTWSAIILWALASALFVFFGIERVLLRRVALLAGIAFAGLFSASLFLYLDRVEDLESRRHAIILAREASVRSAPDASGIESFLVHEGLKVEIRDQRGTWSRIVLADGTEGWIDTRAIERI
ncbi:MAG: tetratricopeptide repeat protein [Ignavibacteriae bacterium]|nr:tetratricopeptide repeat protein [Ignavibacteriota bacterium]